MSFRVQPFLGLRTCFVSSLVVVGVLCIPASRAAAICDAEPFEALLDHGGTQIERHGELGLGRKCFNLALRRDEGLDAVEKRHRKIKVYQRWANALSTRSHTGLESERNERLVVEAREHYSQAADAIQTLSAGEEKDRLTAEVGLRRGLLALEEPTGPTAAFDHLRKIDEAGAYLTLSAHYFHAGPSRERNFTSASKQMRHALELYLCDVEMPSSGELPGSECLAQAEMALLAKSLLALIAAAADYAHTDCFDCSLGEAFALIQEVQGTNTNHTVSSAVGGWLVRYGDRTGDFTATEAAGLLGWDEERAQNVVALGAVPIDPAAFFRALPNPAPDASAVEAQFRKHLERTLHGFGVHLSDRMTLGERPVVSVFGVNANEDVPTRVDSVGMLVKAEHEGKLRYIEVHVTPPGGSTRPLIVVPSPKPNAYHLITIPTARIGTHHVRIIGVSESNEIGVSDPFDFDFVRSEVEDIHRVAYLLGVQSAPGSGDPNLPIEPDLKKIEEMFEIAAAPIFKDVRKFRNGEVTEKQLRRIRDEMRTHREGEYFVYLTGHGSLEKASQPGPGTRENCFHMYEDDGTTPKCVLIKTIMVTLFHAGVARIAVVVDACKSGIWNPNGKVFDHGDTDFEEHIIWTAARRDQTTSARVNLASLFTLEIADTLREEVDEVDPRHWHPSELMGLDDIRETVEADVRPHIDPTYHPHPEGQESFPLVRLTEIQMVSKMLPRLARDADSDFFNPATEARAWKECMQQLMIVVPEAGEDEDEDAKIRELRVAMRNHIIDYVRQPKKPDRTILIDRLYEFGKVSGDCS